MSTPLSVPYSAGAFDHSEKAIASQPGARKRAPVDQRLTTWGSRSDVPDRGGVTIRCRTTITEQPRASVIVNLVEKSPVEPAVPNAANEALSAGVEGDGSKKVVKVS